MRLRIRETGAVVYGDEFRRLHPNTSFPSVLSEELLNTFGADPVFEGPQPELTENQFAKYDGVIQINGKWFTKYIAVDYTQEEISQRLEKWRETLSCTPFQGRMALYNTGLISQVEAAIASADEQTKIAWEYAIIWQRSSPMIANLAGALNLSDTQIDQMFIDANNIVI